MNFVRKEIVLTAKRRGFHLVTGEILDQLPEINTIKQGLGFFFLKHTSASLTLNENASPDVRVDMEAAVNLLAKERQPFYRHTAEGDDDMPAHIKASLIGQNLTIPVSGGRLATGTWQGIYLGEHRERGGRRKITVTLLGF